MNVSNDAPGKRAVAKVYDYLDLMHGVEALPDTN